MTDSAMPHSGEVALQMLTSVEGMVSSAYAKRENGSALRKNAATVRWAQMRAGRGSRSRLTARTASSTSAPKATRPSVTCRGAKPWVPTLMKRKLKPQTRERTAKRSCQLRARPPVLGLAVVVAVPVRSEVAAEVAVVAVAAVVVEVVASPSAAGQSVVAAVFVVSAAVAAVGVPVAVLMRSTMWGTTS